MANTDYTAKHIKVLEGLEPVRRRPGMFIGSTDSKGLHHMIIEVVDNSVDESLAGFTKNVWVTLKKDGSAKIKDDGRGIPVDKHESGVSALEVAMTKLHAGAKFDSKTYKVSGGLHGVGISVVNALSSSLRVEIRRDGKIFAQEYKRGKPTTSVKEVGKTKETGTTTFFIPDKKIFKDSEFKYKIIEQLIRERAYLVPGLKLHLKNERNGKIKHFYFEGGISSLVRFLNRNKKPIHQPIFIKGEKNGEDDLRVEASIQYNDGFSEHIESFVNVINTKDGGTHLTGFKIALTRAINDYAKKSGIIKGSGFTGEDTKEGLTAVVAIKIPTDIIQFESQTKAKLNNAEAQGAVATVVKQGIDTYFEEHPKEARRIIEKIGLAARARMAARAAKEAVIRKSEFFSNALPGKLADCQEKDPAFSELFIVEGDSAGGCFSENTKIALSDGRKVTFKELVQEWKKGKTNYCYTIKKNGEIGLEKIVYPRLTKKSTKVIKVVLDNNESISCTPNHKFMLRDGSFIEAKNLKPKMSLMPFRKTLSQLKGKITIENYKNKEVMLDAIKNFNHKIKYIEKVKEKIDVYDLEVPNTHNFALASGIFVHNSAKQGRNRKFQAILPLGGKILNTERAHLDKIISFDELKDLIIALGMGIGETLNPKKARYHRIIIMTDADVDGQHIDTLLLTFFYRHLKPIIDKGYLYIAIPPLYKIQIGKNSYYAYNDEEKEKILNKKAKGGKKASIQRYKGLGEMNPQQLWETTMDPDKRLLKKITIEDSEKADEVFTMLMGEEVPPRKRFIQMYAKNAELDI